MSLIGVVAEQSIMWMLKQHQSKNFVNHNDVWNEISRPLLTQKWNESKEEDGMRIQKDFVY